jgi:hypothetical protein
MNTTEIMKKLEKDGEKKLENLRLSEEKRSLEETQNAVINIMKKGGEEFKKQTGREMTYSEMREMYG